jgi:hypothetical protein
MTIPTLTLRGGARGGVDSTTGIAKPHPLGEAGPKMTPYLPFSFGIFDVLLDK